MSLGTKADLAGTDSERTIRKTAWVAFIDALFALLDTMPSTLGSVASRVPVVNAGGTGLVLADASNVARFGGATVGDYAQATAVESGATRTINAASSDIRSGFHVTFDRATAQTVTLDADLPAGWAISWSQRGAGQVTFAVSGSGATLRNRSSHTKSAGQWAMGAVRVDRNAGGVIDIVLIGDTAA